MIKNHNDLLDKESLSQEPKELQEILTLLFSKGKYLRSQLVSLISSCLEIEGQSVQTLCRIIEYIHNSSLLHDDFIDQSHVRRNQEAAWKQFSPEQAVLAGDYLLAQASLYLVKEKNLNLFDITSRSIADLARGEFLQRECYHFQNKSLEKINQVSDCKTGSLFKWCLQAPFIFKNREDQDLYKTLEEIGYFFGVLFQRSDDLLDFGIGDKEKKSPLSDMSQSYYNSFSCYLVKEASPDLEKKYQTCQSLEEVHKIFPTFNSTLEDFHNENKQWIQAAEEKVQSLDSFLKGKEKDLLKKLIQIPQLLYWRKKSLF